MTTNNLLPDQYGLYEIYDHFIYSDEPYTQKDQNLYQKYINALHINTGSLDSFLNLFSKEPPKKARLMHAIRNILLDTIKAYYRCTQPNSPFEKVKSNYLKRGPQAYNFLKSSEFQNRLKELDKFAKPSILITDKMWKQIKFTYNEV